MLIPESVVSKYKNKEITRQQLLDASIIHMDDELIELKANVVVELKSHDVNKLIR